MACGRREQHAERRLVSRPSDQLRRNCTGSTRGKDTRRITRDPLLRTRCCWLRALRSRDLPVFAVARNCAREHAQHRALPDRFLSDQSRVARGHAPQASCEIRPRHLPELGWRLLSAVTASSRDYTPNARPRLSEDGWNTRTHDCHLAGGELDQTQFLLGHVSIHTKQKPGSQGTTDWESNLLPSNPLALEPGRRQGGCFRPPWAS